MPAGILNSHWRTRLVAQNFRRNLRTIRHYKKDGGCRFYQNALRSEMVQKGELTSFEEQTEHNRLFSYLS